MRRQSLSLSLFILALVSSALILISANTLRAADTPGATSAAQG